jgi:predicted Rossmann fold nucleotide-binding protein DprA/Smf involved in DNA uptake
LLSALSDAVIVVEAKARSGTLNTANHALNQGKEIFVIPGSPADENYAGSVIVNDGNGRFFEPADGVNWSAGFSISKAF